ncbi:glycosyltransferase [Clostridium perfringens]|uniref:glycosyltransferase n=1 Tax=Clostridium perfringens TaxID=1502 RepID=UPI001CCF6796|nr:glycosyltransferase [Clostridium perfringens]UBK75604.1 glycosyltransferase [Clostridium perfringens]
MNILYTIISFNVGGAEKLLIDLLNNWNNKEDKIILCIINNDFKNEMIEKINENIEIKYLNRKNNSKSLSFIKEYLNFIRDNNIEIIHCQDKESLLLASIGKIFYKKLKIFNTIHDTKIYSNISKLYVNIDKIFTEKIIAISSSVKDEILMRGHKQNKVKVVNNGIDFSIYHNHKEVNINNVFNIGCVARLQPQKKGQDILIKAIDIVKEKYPNIKCYFAGGYEEKDKELYLELKNLVEFLGVEENVIFKGSINNVPEFLNKLDLFVLPSRNEGFGLVVVEAMAAKVPVIASDLEGPKEIIKNDKYGLLFNNEDYRDLAKKIIYSIENKRENLEEVYEYAKKNYDIRNMSDLLREIYYENKN